KLSGLAGMEEVESLSDTHKKSETNQQVSDFHTSEGSVNGSLTDRHYSRWEPSLVFCKQVPG
ncbi:MAG: hypothetical protein ACRC8B_19775, partial [Aeromonas sobria]|uniref:hypothetical protein n=1 Tax=Aeromonas sobria TaxID=646 RepID=UPI003F34B8E5